MHHKLLINMYIGMVFVRFLARHTPGQDIKLYQIEEFLSGAGKILLKNTLLLYTIFYDTPDAHGDDDWMVI